VVDNFIDMSNLEANQPKSIVKILRFTQERDFVIEVAGDVSDEDVINDFKSGRYSESDATLITQRVPIESIIIEKSYRW